MEVTLAEHRLERHDRMGKKQHTISFNLYQYLFCTYLFVKIDFIRIVIVYSQLFFLPRMPIKGNSLKIILDLKHQ